MKLGEMPLTLFIVLAAVLVYLRLSERRNAQQGGSNAQGGASGGGTVVIPHGDLDPLQQRFGVGPPSWQLPHSSDPNIERMRRESGLYGRN